MLYDSTKNLLQSILLSLETGDETLWDDQTESGNACLYEMHQMSGRLYKAYKSDSLNAHSVVQSSLPEKLNRAMPHVRTMVIAHSTQRPLPGVGKRQGGSGRDEWLQCFDDFRRRCGAEDGGQRRPPGGAAGEGGWKAGFRG